MSSFERLSFWYDQVQTQEKGCKMFIVGTKIDQLSSEADMPALKVKETEFAEQKSLAESDFFRTSSKTGEGVQELFQAVAEYCAELTDTGADPSITPDSTVPVEAPAEGDDDKDKKRCCTIL